MENDNDTGKIVRFISKNGNRFRENEVAVCLNGEQGLFLGLKGLNVGLSWFESAEYEILNENEKQEVLLELREKCL